MIIDGHVHLSEPDPWGVEELIKSMDEDSVDKSIVFSFPWDLDNDYIADAVRRFPDRLIGFSHVNLNNRNAKEEIIRSVEVLGLKGVKLHPFIHGYAPSNHQLLDPILKLCAKLELPIVIHGGDDLFTHPFEIEEMAKPFPEVTVVMAHMGFMFLTNQARMVAKRNENILVDTAGVVQGEITVSVEELGAHKVVMGTDSPPPGESIKLTLIKIEMAVPNEDERKLVLGDNYAKLLKIG